MENYDCYVHKGSGNAIWVIIDRDNRRLVDAGTAFTENGARKKLRGALARLDGDVPINPDDE